MTTLVDRFIRYVKINTQSAEGMGCVPSTPCQHDLAKVLDAVEAQFGQHLPQLKWLNMGGGHLMTREGYDVQHLIGLLIDFKQRHPNLEVILEPGSAFCWQTGDLQATVVDVVENSGISTAIVDVSFACHMPDCLEMPYKPRITQTRLTPRCPPIASVATHV